MTVWAGIATGGVYPTEAEVETPAHPAAASATETAPTATIARLSMVLPLPPAMTHRFVPQPSAYRKTERDKDSQSRKT